MDGSYPFTAPTAPTGPVCDTPDWRAYAAAEGFSVEDYGPNAFAIYVHDETVECERCGERHTEDRTYERDDRLLCEDCAGMVTDWVS